MDLSGIEECQEDIQISGSAREIKDITPTPPPILNFFYLWSDFHETWYIASIGIVWVIGYKKNKYAPNPSPKSKVS